MKRPEQCEGQLPLFEGMKVLEQPPTTLVDEAVLRSQLHGRQFFPELLRAALHGQDVGRLLAAREAKIAEMTHVPEVPEERIGPSGELPPDDEWTPSSILEQLPPQRGPDHLRRQAEPRVPAPRRGGHR